MHYSINYENIRSIIIIIHVTSINSSSGISKIIVNNSKIKTRNLKLKTSKYYFVALIQTSDYFSAKNILHQEHLQVIK